MKIKFFNILTFLLSSISFVMGSQSHLYIADWSPEDYGNYPGASYQKKPLPIFVTIAFDKQVPTDIANQYLNFLGTKLNRHFECGLSKNNTLVFSVGSKTTQAQVESILNEANRRFDPEFKTPQEIAELKKQQEKAAREVLVKANAEAGAKQKEKNEQLKQEAAQEKCDYLLHEELLKDSTDGVEKAVQAGANINTGIDGQAPLLWAVLFKRSSCVDKLINLGAKTDIIYSDKTLAQLAAEQGDLESACLLAKHGSNCTGWEEVIGQYLYCQLISAIINDSPEQIKKAVYFGADVHFANQFKKISKETRGFYPYLIPLENYPILLAIKQEKYKAFEELINQGIDINADYWGYKSKELGDNSGYSKVTLLDFALSANNAKAALLLIAKGANIFYSRNKPKSDTRATISSEVLFYMANGNITKTIGLELLSELINHGYNINGDDTYTSALNLFIENFFRQNINTKDFVDILNFIIQHGANPNQKLININVANSFTNPLFEVIYYGLCPNQKEKVLSAISILLDAGANINQQANPAYLNQTARNLDKAVMMTPLYFAIKIGQKEVIDLLIERGARL